MDHYLKRFHELMIICVYGKLKMERLKILHPHNGKAKLYFFKQKRNASQLEAEIEIFVQLIKFLINRHYTFHQLIILFHKSGELLRGVIHLQLEEVLQPLFFQQQLLLLLDQLLRLGFFQNIKSMFHSKIF